MSEAARAAVEAWSRRDARNAERHARAWLAEYPGDPNALQILGAALILLQRAGEAIEPLRRADAAAPDNPQILTMLGRALRLTHDLNGARAAYRRAAVLGFSEAARQLGELETDAGNGDAALAAYEQAVALAPDTPGPHAFLALALQQRREFQRAREHAERALALNPSHQAARIALAQIAWGEGDIAGVHSAVEALLASAETTLLNRALAYGLAGDAFDREGRADEAFAAFTSANELFLKEFWHYAEATKSPYHPQTIERLTRFALKVGESWREPERLPAFLVGFPRSGTTLLDQVLASNSQITCIEEKEIFSQSVLRLLESDAALDGALSLSDAEVEAYRTKYWAGLIEAVGAPLDGRIVVDKLPLNIIFLPLIARIFPGARVIVALRDPRDVLLSNYQQRFGMNPATVQFLSLETGARYYEQVMNLYLLCRNTLPLRFHAVRYEDVVTDLERASRGLADFLDVSFEPAMLNYVETAKRRDITTPSARQVTEPLYTRSIGRWRAYARHLAPVLPALERWAKTWGYEA